MSKSILHLYLHPIAPNSKALQAAFKDIMDEAVEKKVKAIEIIPGKGSGQLMLRVKKFLNQPEQKSRYHRIEVDTKNHGRLFVRFRK